MEDSETRLLHTAGEEEHDPLAVAFEALDEHERGPNRDRLLPIDHAARLCHGNQQLRTTLEDQLTGVLESGKTRAAKAYACEILALMGTSRSVPVLASLLHQPDLAHMARGALAEGQAVVKAVRRHGAILQHGTQQRSEWAFQAARELIRGSHLGRVHTIRLERLSGLDRLERAIERGD